MWTSLQNQWRHRRRASARSEHEVSVIEWREHGVLGLRANPHAEGGPQVLAACFVPCSINERERGIAQLREKGWFAGSRNIMMLGVRQRQFTVLPRPSVPDAELAEAARWQLQDALDYPPEEAVLDVLRLGQDEPPARQQLAVFSLRRFELMRLIAPFTANKVKLEAVDVADCAQRNLAGLHASHGRPLAMLSLREDSMVFSVSRASEVLLSRSFDASKLGTDPAEEAALGERVGLQLQRMLDALERRSPALSPAQILVLSDPASPSSLLTQTAELTGLRVLPFDLSALMQSVTIDAPAEANVPSWRADFLHLLGAALRPAPTSSAALVEGAAA
jgi:MSHA biogenesis protein MshI